MDYQFEDLCINKGYKSICGIDEAGRGPIAGDVYAAAVILPLGLAIDSLNDSKKLSEKQRNILYDIIVSKSISWSVGIATVSEIDDVNILQATFLAMQRAVNGLLVPAEFAIIDGNQAPKDFSIHQMTLTKGDSRCMSVAAASIIAKVSRDRYMQKQAVLYPEYGFEKHKGYGTTAHKKAILEHGPSPIHRKIFTASFIKNG